MSVPKMLTPAELEESLLAVRRDWEIADAEFRTSLDPDEPENERAYSKLRQHIAALEARIETLEALNESLARDVDTYKSRIAELESGRRTAPSRLDSPAQAE